MTLGLSLLVVHPGEQSRGLGRALLERSLEECDGGRRGGPDRSSDDLARDAP